MSFGWWCSRDDGEGPLTVQLKLTWLPWGSKALQKRGVGGGLLQLAGQAFHRFGWTEFAQHLSKHPDAGEHFRRHQQFLTARARAVDVQSRPDSTLGESAVQVQLHVAGAL